ncbi:DUF6241 domain-containing protein [Rossellomorea aquimaris]|uniref:DUF6241 domain-containing protein n=1 Tax=Rossellomorea aquimaris TaxID=189382 RepID=UPI001CD70F20|nr:DUF6241 domain-containing protein [Rossellomorea aquimaris]MCA1055184.1 DUF6241 domain-containing protein [Rossellomorea aquimaris]
MNKKFIFGILGSVLLITVIGVYIAVGGISQPIEESRAGKSSSTADSTEAEPVDGQPSDKARSDEKASGKNPFDSVKPPLKEVHIQQYIHAMSHQKVEANEKWSFFKITDERIDFLLTQLDANNYDNESLYRNILTSWKEGDFSNAASQHNAVWRLQNGTIGKATGNMTAKEEAAFLQEQKKESR